MSQWVSVPPPPPSSKLGGPGDAELCCRAFLDALKKSRRREARLVIARHAHLLPLDHPWRSGRYSWTP